MGTRESHGGSGGVVGSDGPVPSFDPMRGAPIFAAVASITLETTQHASAYP